MFIVSVGTLQSEVVKVVTAAKRSRIVNKPIFVSASKEKGTLTLSLTGEVLSVEKTIEVEVEKDISFATSMLEFQLKISSLPEDVKVEFVCLQNGNIQLRWEEANGIVLYTVDEKRETIETPEVDQSITFPPGKWAYFSRYFVPFTSLANSEVAKRAPITAGINFSKGENGLTIRATNGYQAITTVEEIDWFDKTVTIPSEVIYSISELISSEEIISISLSKTNNQIVISGSGVIAIARIFDGNFPNIDKLFNDKNAPVVWRVDRMNLLETTRRAKKIGGDVSKLKLFKEDSKHFAVLKDVLKEKIGADIVSEVQSGFIVSVRSLEAALTVLSSDEVIVAFEDGQKSLTFLNDDENDEFDGMLKVMIPQVKKS